MGFSSQQYKKEDRGTKTAINPVWRGIGCILLIIVPIMSWLIAGLVLQSKLKASFPYVFSQIIAIPRTQIIDIDKIIVPINNLFISSHLYFGQVFLTIIFSFIGFGIIGFIYAVLYRMVGPSRFGPYDWPPNKL